jgi:hypothetical protein
MSFTVGSELDPDEFEPEPLLEQAAAPRAIAPAAATQIARLNMVIPFLVG